MRNMNQGCDADIVEEGDTSEQGPPLGSFDNSIII